MVEFWCFLVSVVLLFDFLSKVALLLPLMLNSLFNFAAIFQKDFFKQFLHLTIKQKFLTRILGPFLMKIMIPTNKHSVAHFISFA